MRLIDADALMREQKVECDKCGAVRESCLIPCLMEMVEDSPTIDAEPVRHGHWIPIGARLRGGNTDTFQCSGCEFLARALKAGKECGYDFCPNCGARMDGGETNAPD